MNSFQHEYIKYSQLYENKAQSESELLETRSQHQAEIATLKGTLSSAQNDLQLIRAQNEKFSLETYEKRKENAKLEKQVKIVENNLARLVNEKDKIQEKLSVEFELRTLQQRRIDAHELVVC